MMSTSAACSAISGAACSGAGMTAVPRRIRRVRAAAAAAIVSGCGRYPSSKPWCSENQTESMPSRSASSHISSANP